MKSMAEYALENKALIKLFIAFLVIVYGLSTP